MLSGLSSYFGGEVSAIGVSAKFLYSLGLLGYWGLAHLLKFVLARTILPSQRAHCHDFKASHRVFHSAIVVGAGLINFGGTAFALLAF